MKNFMKFTLGLAMAAMFATSANATTINEEPAGDEAAVEVQAPKAFPITICNKTGFGIVGLYISDSDSDEWSDNFLDEELANGECIEISCEDPGKYDISITYYNDVECELYEVNFQKSTKITITLSADGTSTTFSY